MKVKVISVIVLIQLVLTALALSTIFSGIVRSTTAMMLLSLCYLTGLLIILSYSLCSANRSKNAKTGTKPDENTQRAWPEDILAEKHKSLSLLAELEEARNEVDELRRFKSDFLAHISHEIRTPLNAVVGMAELLSRTSLSKEQAELIALITSSGETLLCVINDILNYSKIEARQFALECSEFEPHELVEGTTLLLAEQARLKELGLTTFVSPALHRSYLGDAGRLKQILLNLLGNAMRFAQKGEILVSAINDPDDSECLRFTVKDSSSAMSNSVVISLFTPMTEVDMITARKYGGTGLGLSVSKKMVELMQGKIGVDSSESEGTTYWFSAKLPPAPGESETAEQDPISPRRLLLTGRASSSLAVIMAYGKSWELPCDYRPTYQEALETLNAHADDYQAVVLEPQQDLNESIEFIKQLFASERLSGVHAIVLTDSESTDQSVRQLGLSIQTMRKPFKKAMLRESLRQCHLQLRRTGEIERTASQLKSFVASVGFATSSGAGKQDKEGRAPGDKKLPEARILIVEDNPVNRRLVYLQLKTLALDCDIVENGQEAVDALASRSYDLVLMDCWMPVLDGFAATGKIREIDSHENRHTTIVAMTASAMDTDREECLAAGMDEYISKPVTRAALQALIEKWLPDRRVLALEPVPAKHDQPN